MHQGGGEKDDFGEKPFKANQTPIPDGDLEWSNNGNTYEFKSAVKIIPLLNGSKYGQRVLCCISRSIINETRKVIVILVQSHGETFLGGLWPVCWTIHLHSICAHFGLRSGEKLLIKGMDRLSYEDRLKSLSFQSLEKRKRSTVSEINNRKNMNADNWF